jgi:isoquinoline 1-oxidoreductase subunit beta
MSRDVVDLERRRLLQLLGAGGLVIVGGPLGIRRFDVADALAASLAEPFSPNVYITLHDDGTVMIICHRSEMGQGVRTTLPMIIADEMEADWARCRVEQAVGDEKKYGSQNTDGSSSVRLFLVKYREAGATVRALLEDAAAKQWGVSASEVKATQHRVVHERTGRALAFGALVASARTMPMPDKSRVKVKLPAERRWQGKKMPSVDLVPMTTGTAVYGADVRLPGMKTAVIAHPPVWGGKVKSFDASAALKIPGVEKVIHIPEPAMPAGYNTVGGVAVVATSTWAAMKGREALSIVWEDGPNATYESTAYRATLEASVRQPGTPGRTIGNVEAALGATAKRVEHEYYAPHLSHAQMEPVAAVARFANGTLEAWAPTQSPQDARTTIAKYLGIDDAKVTVHVTLLGGAFGRKSKPDYACEAAWLAREVGAPVRVQWTREDDLRNSYYHTVAAHRLEAGLDASGKVSAWRHRVAYPAIDATFAADVAGAGPDDLTNGASDIPFAIPNMSVEICPAKAHTRIGWYRSVNAIHHGFAIGSFVDELAIAAGKDPAAFLIELLGPDRRVDLSKEGLVAPASNYGGSWEDYPLDTARARRVIEIARDKSGWGTPVPAGHGRGIAMHRSFLSYVALVVEVAIAADGTVTVPRATVAVDAGYVANPDRARSQMEGAVIMGMSNTLYSEISFKDGRVVQSNYPTYPVTRMRAAPHMVDVHIVETEAPPGGIGEPGVPPSGAALCNAIYAATKVRVRQLPVGKQLAGWSGGRATENGGR